MHKLDSLDKIIWINNKLMTELQKTHRIWKNDWCRTFFLFPYHGIILVISTNILVISAKDLHVYVSVLILWTVKKRKKTFKKKKWAYNTGWEIFHKATPSNHEKKNRNIKKWIDDNNQLIVKNFRTIKVNCQN